MSNCFFGERRCAVFGYERNESSRPHPRAAAAPKVKGLVEGYHRDVSRAASAMTRTSVDGCCITKLDPKFNIAGPRIFQFNARNFKTLHDGCAMKERSEPSCECVHKKGSKKSIISERLALKNLLTKLEKFKKHFMRAVDLDFEMNGNWKSKRREK